MKEYINIYKVITFCHISYFCGITMSIILQAILRNVSVGWTWLILWILGMIFFALVLYKIRKHKEHQSQTDSNVFVNEEENSLIIPDSEAEDKCIYIPPSICVTPDLGYKDPQLKSDVILTSDSLITDSIYYSVLDSDSL